MLWVLWDIVVPLIVTFLIGLFTGWLLWRWRRSRIDAEGLSKLRRTSARYRSDVERLQQSNMDLSDRLRRTGAGGDEELEDARWRIENLTEDLKASRREIEVLRAYGSTDANPDWQAELESARQRIAELESQQASGISSMSEEDLRQEIAARDRMIATLEKSLQQFGEAGDTTALMADITIRDRRIEELEARLDTYNQS